MILGYGFCWPDALPQATLRSPLDDTLHDLAGRAADLEQHELLCALRLLRAPGLPEPEHAGFAALLGSTAERLVGRDGAAWSAYGLQPLWIAETPGAPFATQLADPIAVNLDWLIDSQEPSGA